MRGNKVVSAQQVAKIAERLDRIAAKLEAQDTWEAGWLVRLQERIDEREAKVVERAQKAAERKEARADKSSGPPDKGDTGGGKPDKEDKGGGKPDS